MTEFQNGREAKEYLISRIVEEAQRDNVSLSEIERKMMYFTESGWTLPDITQVSEEFDREYRQDAYEKKIARLVAKTYKNIPKRSRDEYERWWTAVRLLKKEDHYISVMIAMAGLRPRGDQSKLLAAGLAIVACILLWIVLSNREIFFSK